MRGVSGKSRLVFPEGFSSQREAQSTKLEMGNLRLGSSFELRLKWKLNVVVLHLKNYSNLDFLGLLLQSLETIFKFCVMSIFNNCFLFFYNINANFEPVLN